MTLERKTTKLVYDRTGTRYWCIPTVAREEVEENVAGHYPYCCAEHEQEFLKGSVEPHNFEASNGVKRAGQGDGITGSSQQKDPDSVFTASKFDDRLNSVCSESDDDALSTTGLASSSQCGLSPQSRYPQERPGKKKPPLAAAPVNAKIDSLWQPKTLSEERDLSCNIVVKADRDIESFFSGFATKQSGGPKNTHSKSSACACPDCDPKRSYMQVQFEAFFARYKLAQSKHPGPEASDSKPVGEVTRGDFKTKVYKMAQTFLVNDGKMFVEISNRLLVEQLHALSRCERHLSNGCSLEDSDGYSTDGSSAESFPDTNYLTREPTHASCERDGIACDHLNPPTAAHATALNTAQLTCRRTAMSSTFLENRRTVDLTHTNTSSVGDRAPFPAANPPAGVVSSSVYTPSALSLTVALQKPPCADQNCAYHRHFNVLDDTCSEASTPEDHFKLALERATDNDSLVQFYVAKLFDHRILNAYREMLIKQRQLKLIEEFEIEEKKAKPKPKPKKNKKSTRLCDPTNPTRAPKSNKQFEELMAKKREEAHREEQAQRQREKEARELAARQQREEQEHAAQVQRARAINKQARELAEKSKKPTKPEHTRSPPKLTKPVERSLPIKPAPKPATSKPPAPQVQLTKSVPQPLAGTSPKTPPIPISTTLTPAPATSQSEGIDSSTTSLNLNPILDSEWPALDATAIKNSKEAAAKDPPLDQTTEVPSSPRTSPQAASPSMPPSPIQVLPGLDSDPSYQPPPFSNGFTRKIRPYLPSKLPFPQASHLTPTPLDGPYTHLPPPGLGALPFARHPTNFNSTNFDWPHISPPLLPFPEDDPTKTVPQPFALLPSPSICSDLLTLQVWENARHSYFSLLMDMGVGLAIQPRDRPFVPFSQLYLKYTSLFNDRVVSLAQFYQFCSLHSQNNPFQFQPDSAHAYPSVRHSFALASLGDFSTGFSIPQSGGRWGRVALRN
ncbi:hypothetical protein L0F63_001879 [Massospora cicadina]|nr:hypothetical protein L0F63_001879 [Massospora cicadina]